MHKETCVPGNVQNSKRNFDLAWFLYSVPTYVCMYFMQRCVECNGNFFSCGTKLGTEDGLGVADTDLIIYVSAVCTANNSNPGTLAFASACELENVLDRSASHHYNYL